MIRRWITPKDAALALALLFANGACHGGTSNQIGGGSDAGAGGKSDGGKGVTTGLSIRGRVSSDLVAAERPGRSSLRELVSIAATDAGEVTVDRICGMPVGRKTLVVTGDLITRETYCTDVSADGSFTVPIGNADDDWVYVLVDSALPKKDQVVGFVGLPDVQAAGATLLSWPSQEQTKDVDVGTLAAKPDGGEIASSKTMGDNQQAFSLSLDQLETLAKNSQLMKALKNDFINADTASGRYYSVTTSHVWNMKLADAVGQWSPLPTQSQYGGYGIAIYHNDSDLNATSFCNVNGAVATSVAVVPPVSITQTDKFGAQTTFGPENPLTNADASPIDNREWCSAANGGLSAGGTGTPPWVLGLPQQLMDPIAGTWVLRKNGVDSVWFDVGVTLPFVNDDLTQPIIAPVPRVRLTVDAGGALTKVEVSWWYYDSTAADDVEAQDPAMIQRLIGGRYNILLTNFEVPAEEKQFSNNDADTAMQTSFTSFSNAWNLGATPPSGAVGVQRLGLDFAVGRSVLSFSFE